MAPYLVGITGGIGSGKSTLSSIFYHLGYKIYNSDDRAKHLMNFNEKIKKDLIDSFGERVYDKNELNKKYLSKRIFNDSEALRKINSIVHPEVINDFITIIWIRVGPTILPDSYSGGRLFLHSETRTDKEKKTDSIYRFTQERR